MARRARQEDTENRSRRCGDLKRGSACRPELPSRLKESISGEFMQQRRLRLGDILDDYCPRERRITNHAIVAMVGDEIRQTRCTTCDSEHEYRQAKVPPARRRKSAGALAEAAVALVRAQPAPPAEEVPPDESPPDEQLPLSLEPTASLEVPPALEKSTEEPASAGGAADEDWPVQRPLIRATLPRPAGQTPERKPPEFTVHPAGSRLDQQRKGQRRRRRSRRHAHGGHTGGHRPGGAGPGARGLGQGPRAAQGQRGGRPHSPGRGPRPGGGRKHGR